MRKVVYIFLVACVLFSCSQHRFEENDFLNFSMSLPDSWSKIKFNGIDSEAYGVITMNKDTVFIDYGRYSNEFKETIKVFSYGQIKKYDSLKMDTKELKRSLTPHIDQNQGVFHKEFYFYENINNKKAKIREPKKIGDGVTGVSFRNVDNEGNHLTIFAKNLNDIEEKQLIISFKTIVFK
jgi:hypothetical protein